MFFRNMFLKKYFFLTGVPCLGDVMEISSVVTTRRCQDQMPLTMRRSIYATEQTIKVKSSKNNLFFSFFKRLSEDKLLKVN